MFTDLRRPSFVLLYYFTNEHLFKSHVESFKHCNEKQGKVMNQKGLERRKDEMKMEKGEHNGRKTWEKRRSA